MLAAAGVYHLGVAHPVTEADLTRMHGVGPKAIGQLRQALTAAGLSFAPGTEPGSGVLLPSRR